MNGYVFINGYGLVRFTSTKKHEHKDHPTQYTGKIKYNHGVFSYDMKKWVEYDYYFDESQIFEAPEKAAQYIIKSQTKRGYEYSIN